MDKIMKLLRNLDASATDLKKLVACALSRTKWLAAPASANPSSFVVAGARDHLPANKSLEFHFEIRT